ncbi:hypothetical protein, partial [Thiolapillus sp.]|uniref:hypothetical protein n=1 Tax=Thiolapillus sp. TaxID=2017437 RepID=UPI003AF86896
LYTDLLLALKGKRLSSVFSPDGTLISASAAPLCGGKMLFSRTAEEQTQWVVGTTQMQGAKIKIKNVLVGRRPDMNILNHSIRYSVIYLQRTSFLIDVLQVCWLFNVCTAYKVQKIEIFTVSHSDIVNRFLKGLTSLLFVD